MQPLARAAFCLERVLKLLGSESGEKQDGDCLQATRCSLAYVKLEMKQYKEALELSNLLLNEGTSDAAGASLRSLTHKKRLAVVRLYGCEASCALGDTAGALKFLTGEKQEESALDHLAVDLAGITPEMGQGKGGVATEGTKSRLKNAQLMVRTSASAASAAMNKLGAAKQLAMSAISLEDTLSVIEASTKFSARRALLYCMLCEGNREGTLAVLRSLR
mmetsp:Transcript_23180/g.53780  ORF Transcript_23180/g.53780 Transcript_23180/m.53780 type:complete len:219 (+) Transcript_23180:793-1449(+)